MDLNYLAPVRLVLAFLPGMRERGHGHVVNVSTLGVLAGAPRRERWRSSAPSVSTMCWSRWFHDDTSLRTIER